MKKQIKSSLPLHILLLFGVVMAASGAVRMVRETALLRAESGRTQEKIRELNERKAELAARIAELETPEVIEREAKEKLNLKKKGEAVVVVVPERAPKNGSSTPVSLRQKITDFFGGIFGRAAPPAPRR